MTTIPAPADRLQQLRAKHRSPAVPAGHVLVDGQVVRWHQVAAHVAEARAAADALERASVAAAREVGVSWDLIAAALGGRRNGETIRRNYGP